jgi:uncharacterized protein YbjQ (UPF0145 family)
MASHKCARCSKESGFLKGMSFRQIRGAEYCDECAAKYIREGINQVRMTTTQGIDGHRVARYIDIESVEVIAGSGVISEFGGDISDFFGARSSAFEQKLQKAKRTALDKLRFLAFEKGGNAVIGIDLDYTEFSGNCIGLIANGTIVEVVPQ